MAGSYNGYTIGSMVGSTFDNNPEGFKDGSATPPHNNVINTPQVDPLDTPIINNDNILDDSFQQSLKGDLDIDDIMASAMHAGKYNGIKPAHLSKI